ncbi:MAG: RNA 2',3'-cyclic phosphodiesterase [Candidatus Poribacteria bacterium]|nr:RNA 2',3'-cyclic phosphodiesterase [Candidatus Poribacteria bacterium]
MSAAKGDGVRCFVAIEIPKPVQALLKPVQTRLQSLGKSRDYDHRDGVLSPIRKVSWTKPGNFHLTLKFLGDVPPEAIGVVSEAVENVAATQHPFSIEFGGIGAFPTLARPRVIWVGIKHGAATVSNLAKAVNLDLKHLGFPTDNCFHPHLTLGRLRSPVNLQPLKNVLRKYDTIDGATVSVNEITVMQSQLHSNGAIYTPLNVCHFSA